MKRGELMDKYLLRIEVPDGEIKNILEELTEAQEKIMNCYDQLRYLGVLTIKKATAK